jgi:hypothetical protein
MSSFATRILVLVLALSSLSTSEAYAQPEGSITISALNLIPTVCALRDDGGVKSLYVFHEFNTGSTGSRFRIQTGPGATLTYLSEVHHFASTQGNTQDGIAICYGDCAVGDQLLVTISYMAYGTSSNCSKMFVVPHPSAQTVEAIRCDSVPVRTYVGDLFVVSGGGCGCPEAHSFQGTPQLFDCRPVPVATSTWGGIKALYRD